MGLVPCEHVTVAEKGHSIDLIAVSVAATDTVCPPVLRGIDLAHQYRVGSETESSRRGTRDGGSFGAFYPVWLRA